MIEASIQEAFDDHNQAIEFLRGSVELLEEMAEMLIARIPSNKGNGYCIQITGNLFTKRNMEGVIADVVDCFLKLEN